MLRLALTKRLTRALNHAPILSCNLAAVSLSRTQSVAPAFFRSFAAAAKMSGAGLFGVSALETAILTPDSGVVKAVVKKGSGPTPVRGDEIVCHYTGKLDNGTVFDSSRTKCVQTVPRCRCASIALSASLAAGLFLQLRHCSTANIRRLQNEPLLFPCVPARCCVYTLLDAPPSPPSSPLRRGRPFVFRVGIGSVISGWDKSMSTMAAGERAIVTCTGPYAYGPSGAGGVIPPNATLHFDIEVFGFGAGADAAKKAAMAGAGGGEAGSCSSV